MYEKLPDNDPDLMQDHSTNSPNRNIAATVLIILTILFVIGAYFATKDYRFHRNNQNTDITTESIEELIMKIKGHEGFKVHDKQNKRGERIIFDDKDFKLTDCSKTNDFYVDYFTFDKLPLNIYENTTINTRFDMKHGFQWSTEAEFQIERWLFGLPLLSLNVPCFMKFFGSCRFNVCEVLREHWDEQFCAYIQNNYNQSCQCPDVLGPGVLLFKDWHYKPVLTSIMKYFSWFASGWYDLKIKLYRRKASMEPFLCVHVHIKVAAEKPKV